MTVEELLKPRYKVIALWPLEPETSLGAIYIEPDCHRGGQWTALWKAWDEMAKYPHLFKKLHWSEDRKSEDMPLFIKEKDGRVWSIKNWGKYFIGRHTPVNNIDKEGETENFASISWHFNSDTILPATKDEYESYINKQQP